MPTRPSFPVSFPHSTLPYSLLPTSEIWNGAQIDTGDEREVMDGPPEGGEVPDLTPIPAMYAPGVNAEDLAEIAERMGN